MTGFFEFQTITPVQSVQYRKLDGTTLQFLIKRDDLIHHAVSGNKWRKLKYNLTLAQSGNFAGIASFGGAFSNHIAALSALGHATNTATVGFIRTNEIDLDNPTLRLAKENGMRLIPLSREDYRKRHDSLFLDHLKEQFCNYLFVPEGGSNDAAQSGLKELADEINQQCDFDRFAVAVGSGGTIQGLLDNIIQPGIGIAVVKDNTLLASLQTRYADKLTLWYEPALGKYGKTTPLLEQFCLDFYQQTKVPIEPIYTGKLLYNLCYNREPLGLDDTERLLVIHTGGLQGIEGLIYRQQISASDWSWVNARVAD